MSKSQEQDSSASSSAEASSPKPSSSSRRTSKGEAFEGDRFNPKGERCPKCGVVIESGGDFAAHSASHAE